MNLGSLWISAHSSLEVVCVFTVVRFNFICHSFVSQVDALHVSLINWITRKISINIFIDCTRGWNLIKIRYTLKLPPQIFGHVWNTNTKKIIQNLHSARIKMHNKVNYRFVATQQQQKTVSNSWTTEKMPLRKWSLKFFRSEAMRLILGWGSNFKLCLRELMFEECNVANWKLDYSIASMA